MMMHRSAMKSSLIDSGSDLPMLKFGGQEQPICPKPRRFRAVLPEFLKPLKCSKHSQLNSEGRSESINIIADKSPDVREFACIGCSASGYSGSPPSRSSNPLIHDVEFLHQMELLSPFTRTKLSDQFGLTSASPI